MLKIFQAVHRYIRSSVSDGSVLSLTIPHLCRISEGLTFSVDDTEIGTAAPPDDGFWGLGEFDQDTWRNNPWQGRSKMAPFDQPVSISNHI